ncbi:MAG: hypothetical protein NC818_07055 [Candidatus Omnitrophica bacterium]|nr:hypothetical protein [Candidatus Omnitrophota bacterium]
MHSKEDEELSEELYKLEKLLRKTVFNSREFKELKKKIAIKGLEMQVFLMVMAKEKSIKENIAKKGRSVFLKLSPKDKEFLKKHGIRW